MTLKSSAKEEKMADVIGNRSFVEVPGSKKHELPPLLVRSIPYVRRMSKILDEANLIVQDEMDPDFWTVPDKDKDCRRMDIALNLTNRYKSLAAEWSWGDSILEWIRQCETTFEGRTELRHLLHNDVWPHAGRCSFIQLIRDKTVPTGDVLLERAIGLRLTFRRLPPIRCFTDQYLFYLNSTCAPTVYETWASLSVAPVASLPPERFTFQVLNTDLGEVV